MELWRDANSHPHLWAPAHTGVGQFIFPSLTWNLLLIMPVQCDLRKFNSQEHIIVPIGKSVSPFGEWLQSWKIHNFKGIYREHPGHGQCCRQILNPMGKWYDTGQMCCTGQGWSFQWTGHACSPIWMCSHWSRSGGQNRSHCHKFIHKGHILQAKETYSAPVLHTYQKWSQCQV